MGASTSDTAGETVRAIEVPEKLMSCSSDGKRVVPCAVAPWVVPLCDWCSAFVDCSYV